MIDDIELLHLMENNARLSSRNGHYAGCERR